MTETDATKKPLDMPAKFIPYLQKYRIYKLLKGMLADLVIQLPIDHLKHMKIYLNRYNNSSRDTDRIILLVSPKLHIDVKLLVKELIKDLGFFVITRHGIMDKYEKDDDYDPKSEYLSAELMAKVTRVLSNKEPVVTAGWLMFDHPCSVREARCLQQEGVLPTVTLVLTPPPPLNPPTDDPYTLVRTVFNQDFDGLKAAYKATLKEVHIDKQDQEEIKIAAKCYNAIRACTAGAQGSGQGFHVVGAPGTYRVVLIGPRGSGRKTQAKMCAQHFGLVFLDFWDMYKEAKQRNDEVGEKLRSYGPSVQLKAEIVRRKISTKECLDNGWIMTGYPITGLDFDQLDTMPTPPNRIIFLNVDYQTCRNRVLSVTVDWCTGKRIDDPNHPRARKHPGWTEAQIEYDLDYYFTEALAELRAAAGITAVEISAGTEAMDEIQTKIRAAVIAAPSFDIISCSQVRNARGD